MAAIPTFLVAILLAILLTLSYANLFGYPTEMVTRAGILSGLVVAACASIILLARRKEVSPQDFQRLRWAISGCLIGLPALIIADRAVSVSTLHQSSCIGCDSERHSPRVAAAITTPATRILGGTI
jgi:predicted Kef-type K+ transport protein